MAYSPSKIQISGTLEVEGQTISAQAFILALAEQGITISLEQSGLRVGRQIVPFSQSSMSTCPFITQIREIKNHLEQLNHVLSLPMQPTSSTTMQSVTSANPLSRSETGIWEPPTEISSQNESPQQDRLSPFNLAFNLQSQSTPSSHEKRSEERFKYGTQRVCVCGARLSPRAVFCAKCGTNVRSR